jgi:hypothetical protein
MARLRTPAMMVVSMAIKARTEGMGVRATGRVLDKSHATIIRWEQRLEAQVEKWSPAAPIRAEVTISIYSRRREPFPPEQVKDGQSTSSKEKPDTGSAHKQESKMPNYSSKESKVLGNGLNRVLQLDGLQTENEVTAKSYGS